MGITRLVLAVYIMVTMVTLGQVNGQDKIPCDASLCVPPKCYCSTSRIPLDIFAEEVPQMIIFAFSGPMHVEHGEYIRDLFTPRRRNPNGSPIRATLFVSDDEGETDYCTVNNLWADGHEVASFSVTRRGPPFYWAEANQNAWAVEIETQRQYILDNTSIPGEDIVGFRSPHLQTGGNTQYRFAQAYNYTYDSSIVLPAKFNEPLEKKLWPYTMDAPGDFECYSFPCPTANFSGLWQFPIQPLTDIYGKPCNYLDSCINKPEDAEEVYDMLMQSFNRSYMMNRAPMMVNFLNYKDFFDNNAPWALQGVHQFIDEVLSYAADDVYFVTYRDVIEWMSTPLELKTIKFFPPFHRNERESKPCIEERPAKSFLDGVSLLIVEIFVCLIAFIVLFIKDKE